jgi:hypothetical protein
LDRSFAVFSPPFCACELERFRFQGLYAVKMTYKAELCSISGY